MRRQSFLVVAASLLVPVSLLIAGCSKSEEPASSVSDSGSPMGAPGERMGGPMGRPGGPMGGPGGRRFEPVAANATAPQIFQQKCQGCHGDKGQGKNGPALTKVAQKPDAELHQIIHDGHDKMPSFAKQMTEAQIDSLVAYVKKFGVE